MQNENNLALKNFLKKSEVKQAPPFPLQFYKRRSILKDFLITLGVNRTLKEKHQKPIEQFCRHLSQTKKPVETPNNSKTKIFFKDQPIGQNFYGENQQEDQSANEYMKSGITTHSSTPNHKKNRFYRNKVLFYSKKIIFGSFRINNRIGALKGRLINNNTEGFQEIIKVPHKTNNKILGQNLKVFQQNGNNQDRKKEIDNIEIKNIKDIQNQVDITVELPNEIKHTENPVITCAQCQSCGQPSEETIQGIIEATIQMGLFGLQTDQNYINDQVRLNFTYFQHLTQNCPCKTCQCGQFRCPFNQNKDQNFLPIQSYAWNNLSPIHEDQYESLTSQYRLVSKSPNQYQTTNRNTFTSFTPRELSLKQKKKIHYLPFIGTSNYQNNFINWKNQKDLEIYKRPLEEHVSRNNDVPIFGNTTYSENYRKNLNIFENYKSTDIKNLQDFRQRSPLKNGYPDQYKTQYSASFHQGPYVARLQKINGVQQSSQSPQKDPILQKSFQFENNAALKQYFQMKERGKNLQTLVINTTR